MPNGHGGLMSGARLKFSHAAVGINWQIPPKRHHTCVCSLAVRYSDGLTTIPFVASFMSSI